MTVHEICQYLQALAPLRLAESWDNVGLLVGRRNQEIHRAITCLTLTQDVVREAVDADVQMIITHHPLLFRGTKKITDETEEGRILLNLMEHKIAVYSAHTAFDSAEPGINQTFATLLGLNEIRPLRSSVEEGEGSGRYGVLSEPAVRDEFLTQVSRLLRTTHLETCWAGKPIHRIAVACGAAAEFLPDAIRCNCDTFITGEARFHSVLESRSAEINLILVGHYGSERPFMESLAQKLQRDLPQINFFCSTAEQNPLELFTANRAPTT